MIAKCLFFLKCNLMRHSSKRIHWLVQVDTTQLDLNLELKLSRVQLPDAGNSGETIYEVKPLEQPSRDMEVIWVKKRRWKGQEICIRVPSPARGSSVRPYLVLGFCSMKRLAIFEVIYIASPWMGWRMLVYSSIPIYTPGSRETLWE